MTITAQTSEITQKAHSLETKLQEALKYASPTATTSVHISDEFDEICAIEITSVPLFDLCFAYQTAKWLAENNGHITQQSALNFLSSLEELRPNSMDLHNRLFGKKTGTSLRIKLFINDVIDIDAH